MPRSAGGTPRARPDTADNLVSEGLIERRYGDVEVSLAALLTEAATTPHDPEIHLLPPAGAVPTRRQ
ncbi:hypothetical protein ACH4E8_14025 [Streptomyces sp. NPDC017979]|uniref:hypothetical protein n=1 Tax=Streptomyces sp. NPDC017979 TaxID=3365024 RepID=UPI0037AE6807